MNELVQIEREGARMTIDARQAIRAGHHPRGLIIQAVQEAPQGTLCEIHVPHRTGPLIAALEDLGFNVAVHEVEPFHFLLRVLKL